MKIVGIASLQKAATRIRSTPEASKAAAYRAANAVAAKVVTQAKREISAQINLTQRYIAEQTRTTKASSRNPVAEIRMRMRAVTLARFAAKQVTRVARRAKGDARRGIPAGRKQAGVGVKVNRQGGRRIMPGAFLIPLRAGRVAGGNGFGVFTRTGKGRDAIKHHYGPSPDQLFRRWISESKPDIRRMLADAYASQLRYELKGTRK